MGRLFLFLIIGIIAVVIAVIKSAVGEVTGNEELKNTTLKGETKKVMDKTAKGIGWMEQQWEQSKKREEAATPEQPMNDLEKEFYTIAAKEITQKKLDPAIMSKAFSESDGDEKKAVALYLRYRVAEIGEQYQRARAQEAADDDIYA